MVSVLAVGESSKEFELTPKGTHMARLYSFIDLGTQTDKWGSKRKIRLSWELPTKLMEDGRPFTIHQTYNYSLAESSNLRKDLEGMFVRTLDENEVINFFELLGTECLIQVVHEKGDTKTYANIASVSGLVEGMKVPRAEKENDIIFFDLDSFNQTIFNGLSQATRKKIAACPEYIAITQGPAAVVEEATQALEAAHPSVDFRDEGGVEFDEDGNPIDKKTGLPLS